MRSDRLAREDGDGIAVRFVRTAEHAVHEDPVCESRHAECAASEASFVFVEERERALRLIRGHRDRAAWMSCCSAK